MRQPRDQGTYAAIQIGVELADGRNWHLDNHSCHDLALWHSEKRRHSPVLRENRTKEPETLRETLELR